MFDCGISTRDYFTLDSFSKLIKALGAAHHEEEHGKVGILIKRIRLGKRIFLNGILISYLVTMMKRRTKKR